MTESLEQEIQTLRSLFWSERDPDGRGFVPLADAYRRAGDVRQAMDLLTDGLARHPEFAPGHVVAALVYVDQGMVAEGEIAARKALALDAENVYALGTLLRVLEGGGRGDEAAEVRGRLLSLDPDVIDGDGVLDGGMAAAGPPADEAGVAPAELHAAEHAAESSAAEPPGEGGLIDISGLGSFDIVEDASDAEPEPEEEQAPAFELAGITLSDDNADDAADSDEAADPDDTADLDATVEIAALAPDAEIDLDMSVPDTLAPLEEDADVLDIGALAPDEPVETSEADADALDFALLAPDEPAAPAGADVLDIGALAPDEPAAPSGEDAIGIALLAPDEPADMAGDAVLDIGALAPDEPATAGEGDTIDIALLAPDEPADILADGVLDIGALAPDEPADTVADAVLDIGALAPDEPVAVEEAEAIDIALFAPDEPAELDHGDGEPDDEREPGPDARRDSGAPIYTRTLAELYVKQGFLERALEVLRHLQRGAPGDEGLARRIAELEARPQDTPEVGARPPAPRRVELPGGPEAAALVREAERAEEVESLARDLDRSGDRGHEVDTPFAWTEQETEEAPSGHEPSVREYFEDLLTWRSREGS